MKTMTIKEFHEYACDADISHWAYSHECDSEKGHRRVFRATGDDVLCSDFLADYTCDNEWNYFDDCGTPCRVSRDADALEWFYIGEFNGKIYKADPFCGLFTSEAEAEARL